MNMFFLILSYAELQSENVGWLIHWLVGWLVEIFYGYDNSKNSERILIKISGKLRSKIKRHWENEIKCSVIFKKKMLLGSSV